MTTSMNEYDICTRTDNDHSGFKKPRSCARPMFTTPHGTLPLPVAAVVLLAWLGVSADYASGQGGREEMFTDSSKEVGLDFVHFNGMSGEFYFSETMGHGAALLDYDNDGDLDLYIVQGRMLGENKSMRDALFPLPNGQALNDRLFRNDLHVSENRVRTLRFTDATDSSGILATGYGMGAATGDINNDGWVDIYVTNFGNNQLFQNNRDGTFSEVTKSAGVDEPRWSVSSAFLDYDRDGWLDLFVGNYVNFTLKNHIKCQSSDSAQDYCSPLTYSPVPNRLFRNRGDGTFEDVSARSGIIKEYGGALGVVVGDFNGDDWPDLYVANDGRPNQLWMNQKNGTFQNEALFSGTSVNMEGKAEASMGVDAADFDADGDEDLFMTHLLGETNTLYVNNGEGWFEDRSLATGLAAPSKAFTSFGVAWFDYNNNGLLDLFIANGEVKTIPMLASKGDPYPLHQTNQLFANQGDGRFKEVSAVAGNSLKASEVSRGAAFGDVDNDGDTDILVLNNNGPARLLINNVGNQKHWIGLRVLDRSRRDALGARVAVLLPSGVTLWRRVRSAASYASSNDPRVLVGMDETKKVQGIRVYWPSGARDEWTDPPLNRYTTVREGEGEKGARNN